jgi:hypothetical protein
MLCQRIASDHPSPKSGWYHFYEQNMKVSDFAPKAKEAPKGFDVFGMMKEFHRWTNNFQIQMFADALGVLPQSLVALGCAWSKLHNAWAFPMSGGHGELIGIRLRNNEGFKWAVSGSRQGLFAPNGSVPPQPIAFLPEGPTDTAALLSLGFYAIGRPTCNSGNDLLKIALKQLGIFKVVIVADNDALVVNRNREWRPGVIGAEKLAQELGLRHCIWIPPTKDARSFLQKGGTRAMIESDLKNKTWNK